MTKVILEKSAVQLRKWVNQGHQIEIRAVNVRWTILESTNLPEELKQS